MKDVLFEMKVDDERSLVIPGLSHAKDIFELIDVDRDHLGKWLPWVEFNKKTEDTRENLTERIVGFNQKKQASFYGTHKGEFIASVGFNSLVDGEGEIGYWLLSQHCRNNHMKTFVKACIDYGFDELGLNRILIKCAEGNVASAAIPKKLGFTQSDIFEKEIVRNGKDRRVIVYTLSRNEWSV